MGLSKYEMKETASVHIRDAAGNLMYAEKPDGTDDLDKPVVALVYGPGSKQYAKAKSDENNRMTRRMVRKGKTDRTAEETLQDTIAFLVDCTQTFENADGLTPHAIYSNQKLSYIRDQVYAFIHETENFT